jgi:hypothetical protein
MVENGCKDREISLSAWFFAENQKATENQGALENFQVGNYKRSRNQQSVKPIEKATVAGKAGA